MTRQLSTVSLTIFFLSVGFTVWPSSFSTTFSRQKILAVFVLSIRAMINDGGVGYLRSGGNPDCWDRFAFSGKGEQRSAVNR